MSAVEVFWKHCGKRRNCSKPVWRTFSPFHQTRNCRLQTLLIWKSLKFVVWERVKWWFLSQIWEKKNVGKEEYAGYHYLLLFPQCFQKSPFVGLWKPRIVCERVKTKWAGVVKKQQSYFLTPYHTIVTFEALEKNALWEHCEKRKKKILETTMFITPWKIRQL